MYHGMIKTHRQMKTNCVQQHQQRQKKPRWTSEREKKGIHRKYGFKRNTNRHEICAAQHKKALTCSLAREKERYGFPSVTTVSLSHSLCVGMQYAVCAHSSQRRIIKMVFALNIQQNLNREKRARRRNERARVRIERQKRGACILAVAVFNDNNNHEDDDSTMIRLLSF